MEIREIDNTKVLNLQLQQLKTLREKRDAKAVSKALSELTHAATQNANILEYALHAARCRCTLGEISAALESVFGRYTAKIQTVSGIYKQVMNTHPSFSKAVALSQQFAERVGRRPRILVAKMGQDGHDRGAKVIASSFSDMGFDVDLGPLFQTPDEVAKQAIENDVHIIGISTLAGGHKTLIPELIQQLKRLNRSDIRVIAGGVIPEIDYDFLKNCGVLQIFGPGTVVSASAVEILNELLLHVKV